MTTTTIAADGNRGFQPKKKKKAKAPKGWWRNTVVRDYVPNVLKILDRAGIEQPTLRRVFYTLAQRYPDFPKTNAKYEELKIKLTDVRLRRKEFSDWGGYDYRLDTFVDDSRPDVIVPHYQKPEPFVRQFLFGIRRILEKYNIPYWEGQKDVVEVMTEKQSMEASFRQITKPKQVAVIINRGDSSVPYLYEQYLRWKSYQQRENKNVHILFFSDLDTDGEYMHKNMIDKFLRMIELDVLNSEGEEEPLNWDWTKEHWDNEAELEKFKHKSIGGRTREPLWHTKHYDPDKPKFTFERIGLTEQQANELSLTRLDETPISELKRGTQQYDFAKRHGGYSFAVELDAFLIEQQEAFEEIVNNAIDKYHNEVIWQYIQETCGEEVKDKEVEKRVEFSDLADAEYFDWKKDREEQEKEEAHE